MSDWLGMPEFFRALDDIEEYADGATKELVVTAGVTLTREAQGNFSGSHRRGEPHVGGSKPNIVSGDLRRSIRADMPIRFGKADWGTSVAPRMIYGRRVELGFRGSPGYPYFEPAVQAVHPKLERIAVDVWTKYMKRV